MQKIVRFLLVALVVIVIGFGEYQIIVKGPEYAKPHSGTIVSVYETRGRYSTCLGAVVQFDNGDLQRVSPGYMEYKKGDRFTGTLSWNPVFGISGAAYSWRPEDWYIWATIPAIMFNLLFIIGIIIALFVYAFRNEE
jgi:hypothetical protein